MKRWFWGDGWLLVELSGWTTDERMPKIQWRAPTHVPPRMPRPLLRRLKFSSFDRDISSTSIVKPPTTDCSKWLAEISSFLIPLHKLRVAAHHVRSQRPSLASPPTQDTLQAVC